MPPPPPPSPIEVREAFTETCATAVRLIDELLAKNAKMQAVNAALAVYASGS